MTDASEHALDYATIEVGGKSVSFGKLTVTDRAALLRKLRLDKRAELADAMGDGRLAPEQQYVELRKFDDQIWGASRWGVHMLDSDFQATVLRASLLKKNTEAETDAVMAGLSIDFDDLMKLTADITGMRYVPPIPPAPPEMRQVAVIDGRPAYVFIDAPPAGGDEANPTTPPAYGK